MATRVGVKVGARTALAICIASVSVPALSLGLGEIRMQSFLNEPLEAEVALLDVRDLTVDDIRIRLAEVDDFDRLGVDRSYFLTGIKFDIRLDPATGQGVIRLTTEDAVLEPYLDLIIEARWPSGRVLREYTVLVDPPAFRQDMISVSASERVEAERPDKPAVAPQPERAPQTTTTTSGDRVAMRESSLPPGEMPQRAFSAETADAPRAGSRYMVRRDETLWQIASSGRPEGISVQQAMLDIQRVNPEAFIDGNINRIKAGYIIYLPRAGEVETEDLADALAEVRAQNRAWQEGRPLPGVSAAATLRVSADAPTAAPERAPADAAGATAALAEERARTAAQSSDDDADLGAALRSADSSDAMSASLADAAAAVAASDAANSQLGSQLAAMSDRLDTLEQIVSLKDEQIATLEQALREAREAAAAAAAAPAVAAAPRPAAATPTPTPPAAASGLAAIPWLPIAGGLLLIVLAVALLLRRRAAGSDKPLPVRAGARASQADDAFAGVNLKKEALSGAGAVTRAAVAADDDDISMDALALADADADAPAPAAEDVFNRGGSRGYGERKNDDYIDEGAAGDALAEADIYIAYGRYLQAIELLNTAIESEPDNSAYRLKLIELYVDMGEEADAAEQLDALRARGDADAIARGEALVGGTALGAATGGLRAAAPAAASALVPGVAGAASGADGDFADEDLADEDLAEGTVGEGSLDLDLDLDDDFDSDELTALAEATPEPDPDPATTGYSSEPLEFDGLEIEDDRRDEDDGEAVLDLEEPDDELDLTEALAQFKGVSLDADDHDDENNGEFMIAADADQMATKLDLARAYLDMGDSEGARGILEEVAGAGSGDQQQEARELLSRIG